VVLSVELDAAASVDDDVTLSEGGGGGGGPNGCAAVPVPLAESVLSVDPVLPDGWLADVLCRLLKSVLRSENKLSLAVPAAVPLAVDAEVEDVLDAVVPSADVELPSVWSPRRYDRRSVSIWVIALLTLLDVEVLPAVALAVDALVGGGPGGGAGGG
jgi:hypothetical protein